MTVSRHSYQKLVCLLPQGQYGLQSFGLTGQLQQGEGTDHQVILVLQNTSKTHSITLLLFIICSTISINHVVAIISIMIQDNLLNFSNEEHCLVVSTKS